MNPGGGRKMDDGDESEKPLDNEDDDDNVTAGRDCDPEKVRERLPMGPYRKNDDDDDEDGGLLEKEDAVPQ